VKSCITSTVDFAKNRLPVWLYSMSSKNHLWDCFQSLATVRHRVSQQNIFLACGCMRLLSSLAFFRLSQKQTSLSSLSNFFLSSRLQLISVPFRCFSDRHALCSFGERKILLNFRMQMLNGKSKCDKRVSKRSVSSVKLKV
jgi:hypothetical protein